MRRILIDKKLKDDVKEFCDNLFVKERNVNFKKPLENLHKLSSDLKSAKNKKFGQYVAKIITEYKDILKADPTKMVTLISEFSRLNSSGLLEQKVQNKKMKFYEAIVEAMHYEDLRDKEYLSYLKNAGLKSCIYCNSQLAVVIDFTYYDKKTKRKINKRSAKLELDHFYPKSKYPFLSTSFYNLYPVCGNCNRSKSSNPVSFELYTTDPKKIEVFNFWIDDESIIKYWISLEHKDLIVKFEQINGDIELLENHNKTFGIQGIYDTQNDLAEELVHKAKAYSEAYKKNLVETFKDLFPDKTLINRLLIGNYDKAEDMYKRPMAKYTQDVAKQLKLI